MENIAGDLEVLSPLVSHNQVHGPFIMHAHMQSSKYGVHSGHVFPDGAKHLELHKYFGVGPSNSPLSHICV